MNNKILIRLIVPELGETYDMYIPVNEIIWKLKTKILNCIIKETRIKLDLNKEYLLINKNDSKIYSNNEIVINTNIRNASEIILLSTPNERTKFEIKEIDDMENKKIIIPEMNQNYKFF